MKSHTEASARLTAMKLARDENMRHLKIIENQLYKQAEQSVIWHRKQARQFGRGTSTWTPPAEHLFQEKYAALKARRQSEIDALTRKIARRRNHGRTAAERKQSPQYADLLEHNDVIDTDKIAISFNAKAEIGLGFKINRAKLTGATDEEKHKMIAAAVEAAATHFNRAARRPGQLRARTRARQQ